MDRGLFRWILESTAVSKKGVARPRRVVFSSVASNRLNMNLLAEYIFVVVCALLCLGYSSVILILVCPSKERRLQVLRSIALFEV